MRRRGPGLTRDDPGLGHKLARAGMARTNGAAASVHGRMPAILDPDRFGDWVPGEQVLFGPYSPERLAAPIRQ